MGKLARVVATVLGAALAMFGLALGGTAAADETDNAPNPAFWPSSPAVSPQLSGYANAVRFAGADRYSTGLALTLALRGRGGFPFESPTRQSVGATNLAQNRNWWGAATCPWALIIVAGDNPADALAASALSDPSGKSTEPFLQRSAAADPLFDPIGGFSRVDTDNAPIIVTASARTGASLLSPAAKLAVRDMVSGGCQTASQAIVVGGAAAVPTAVDAELVSLGIDEVFRISGANRFATAAAITNSLGTAEVPVGVSECDSPTASTAHTKMGFYANSVVEYRASATECELLGRTVVLADGVMGADALAAGWWTSFWQTPILLHNGESSLPEATAAALATTGVDNIVVLGGTARIPTSAVEEAVALTGARAVRVSGANRYETSIAMAKHFGGWWAADEVGADPDDPDSTADNNASFANSMACFAASSGEGASAKGWPDALSAAPLCASLNGAALAQNSNATSAPARALAPTSGLAPTQAPSRGSAASQPGHEAVPIILVPASSVEPTSVDETTVPFVVQDFLTQVFSPDLEWCSSNTTSPDCLNPGFAVLVGGSAAINSASARDISSLMGGGGSTTTEVTNLGLAPNLDDGFYTTLDLEPVFDTVSSPPASPTPQAAGWFCVPRGSYRDVRWLSVVVPNEPHVSIQSFDVMMANRYVTDSPSVQRLAGVGAPVCVALPEAGANGFDVMGVSLAGRVTPRSETQHVNPSDELHYQLDSPIELLAPSSASGHDSSSSTPVGATTTWTFTTPSPLGQTPIPTATSRGVTEDVSQASISLTLTRGALPSPTPGMPTPAPILRAAHVFNGSWSINTAAGTVSGRLQGEAVFDAGVWKLRGQARAVGGSWNITGGSGGFSADIAINNAGTLDDDSISWFLDGLVN